MNRSSFIACLFVAMVVSLSAADEPKTYSYTGEITGIVCVACRDKVSTTLTKNLPDTVSVNVKPGDKPGIQKLLIVSKSDHLELGQAVTALGDCAKEYEIKTLTRD